MLQSAETRRSSDEALATEWVDRMHRGKTFAEAAIQDDRIRNLSRDEVNAAVRKYFDPARISTVKAGSFEKAP